MFDYIVARLAREGMSPTHVGLADVIFKGQRAHGLRSAQRRAIIAAHAAELAAFDKAAYITVTRLEPRTRRRPERGVGGARPFLLALARCAVTRPVLVDIPIHSRLSP